MTESAYWGTFAIADEVFMSNLNIRIIGIKLIHYYFKENPNVWSGPSSHYILEEYRVANRLVSSRPRRVGKEVEDQSKHGMITPS